MTRLPSDSAAHASASLHGDALMTQLRQGWKPLPNKTLLALVMAGLRVRLMRSVITMISVVLAIAFLTYIGLGNHLNYNLARSMQRYAANTPVDPAILKSSVASLEALDLFSGLSVEQQRAVAVTLGMDQTDAAEYELITLPDKINKARFDQSEAEKAVEKLQADTQAMKADLDDARGKVVTAKEHADALEARKSQLTDGLAFSRWIKSGSTTTNADMAAHLSAALTERYHELLAGLLNPVKLSDGDLDQLDSLLAMARPKAGKAIKPIDAAILQERDKRAGAELRKLLQNAGLNTEKTLAGDPMDTWLLVMALLTCAIGIANAMLMSVTERFREIGTMKCLGAQDNLVVKLFLLESAFLGVIGALVGIVLGVVIALASAALQFRGYGMTNFPWGQSLPVISWALAGGIFLAVTGATYPAIAASRMRPVDALRVDE